MAADDPNFPMPPEERLFAAEELRPLDELPRPLAAALRSQPDLRAQVIAIRRHFLELQAQAEERLRPTLGGVAIGSADHMDKVMEWRAAIHRDEVPAEFGKLTPLQARQVHADHFYFGEILGLVQLTLERGLWRALTAAGLVPPDSAELAPSEPQENGEQPTEAKPHEQQHTLQLMQAAVDMGNALPDLLGAFRLILGLLTNVTPADLIRGRGAVVYAREAGSTEKYARGIQAAVDHVYRDGMTEQQCWKALGEVEDHNFTVEGAEYEFRLDRRGTQIVTAWQIDDRTSRERSVKRASFHPYFARARDTTKTASPSVPPENL